MATLPLNAFSHCSNSPFTNEIMWSKAVFIQNGPARSERPNLGFAPMDSPRHSRGDRLASRNPSMEVQTPIRVSLAMGVPIPFWLYA